MRVLVTGAAGKVDKATVPHLQAAGHSVTASDRLGRGFDRPDPGPAPYVTADLTDAGQVFSLVGGFTEALDPDGTHRARAVPAEGRA
jgi:nucleoside-diphosphate-sugar epimerase